MNALLNTETIIAAMATIGSIVVAYIARGRSKTVDDGANSDQELFTHERRVVEALEAISEVLKKMERHLDVLTSRR